MTEKGGGGEEGEEAYLSNTVEGPIYLVTFMKPFT
jgi:hypothetical protein